MKILIICSKRVYFHVPVIKKGLEMLGHEVFLPNCIDSPREEFNHMNTDEEHREWKQKMYKESAETISKVDAVLVLNIYIEGRGTNFIGGATMLEMYEAFRQNKKVFTYRDIPECTYHDELNGLITECINTNLSNIK